MKPAALRAVPVEQIMDEREHIDLRRAALNAAAAVPWGLGWVTGQAVNRAVDAAELGVAAVKLGWREARAGARPAV